jgi:DNA-binding response OmpR family regulator
MRILIAEDDNGYAVDTVQDGLSADAALAIQAFDLLILNLGLPHLAGLESCDVYGRVIHPCRCSYLPPPTA